MGECYLKQRKIPMRTCLITREKCEKKDLVRIVRTPDGLVEIDLSGKKNGRGAYLKKDINVFEKAKNSRILDKVLEIKTEDKLYDDLFLLIK